MEEDQEGKAGVERVLSSSEGEEELVDGTGLQSSPKDQQNTSPAPEADPQPEVNTNHDGPSDSSPREIKTSDVYQLKGNIPKRFNHPDWFQGYGNEIKKNPVYRTSTSEYGAKPPSVHTMPTKFSGRSQKFTGYLGQFGMYRNHSLNTELDKSKV